MFNKYICESQLLYTEKNKNTWRKLTSLAYYLEQLYFCFCDELTYPIPFLKKNISLSNF